MATWTQDELDRIDGSDELEIAAGRADGSLRNPTPIWVVRVGDGLYVRAAYGRGSGWHRETQASGRARISAGGVERDVSAEVADADLNQQVDAAYHAKYGGRYASIVDSITDDEHRASTLRLLPIGKNQ